MLHPVRDDLLNRCFPVRLPEASGIFRSCRAALLFSCLLIPATLKAEEAAAPEPTPEQVKFFETKVRPLLAEHCFKCHGPEDSKGNLRLSSRGEVLLGGESGPAIVPGSPDESLLLEAVRYESYEMPPSGKLPDRDIQILTDWVKMGAPWPGDDGKVATREKTERFSEEDRKWWAIQPVQPVTPPEVKHTDWPKNDIDRFILAAMESQSLSPAPEADRAKLIRRVTFDLTGLPPTPQQVRDFVNDPAADAYERLVDRLLGSPDYGERWARHWLDLVRYADSDGYRLDSYRPNAWRYRDYVIDSLNADKPYDRFVQEQLAGDELFPNDPQAWVGTGFLRHGIYEYNNLDVRAQWDLMQNEVTDATADVFLGLGLQCARCHDHKFDPLLQQDYYRLRAFLEPLDPRDTIPIVTPEERAKHQKQWDEYVAQTGKLLDQIEEIEAEYRDRGEKDKIKRFPEEIQLIIAKPADERSPLEQQLVDLAWRQVQFEYDRIDQKVKGETKERLLALRRELAAFESKKPAPLPLAMIVNDVGPEAPPTIIPKKRVEVLPGIPSILDPNPAEVEPLPGSTGRRAALAKWLTEPSNPLTVRVIVNRIWQYHFGRGLAPNSSDFGRLGGLPSHPELLDWLTADFLDGGWRWKNLHRQIVTSATYRQSTQHPEFAANQVIDPANQWYWRSNTRRLDAEQIRDAMLQITGQLDRTRGGEGVLPDLPRRSIYTQIMRNSRDPLLDVFDLPQFFSSASYRDTTTTPVQSLLLINSPTMLRYARSLAEKTVQDGNSASRQTLEQQISRVWEGAFGRAPSPGEVALAKSFVRDQQRRRKQETAQPLVQTTVVTGKVPYRDGQALMFEATERAPGGMEIPHEESLDVEDFTIEAYFQVRSVAASGAVRTLAAKWNPATDQQGWQFGITGKGSRRKPQTLVLLVQAKNRNGELVEYPLFSDQHIEINKPYYAGVSFKNAKDGSGTGAATFFLKDLTNDDEPLLVSEIPHRIQGGFSNREPLTIGCRKSMGWFDGLIDDVRLSGKALSQGELLTTTEGVADSTIGYWQFEPTPGLYRNTASSELNILPAAEVPGFSDADMEAFADLCHVLLNSNEFLYVD